MYYEQMNDPETGPLLDSNPVSLDENLKEALLLWNSGLEYLEQQRGWPGRYYIRNQEFDKMLQLTQQKPDGSQVNAEMVLSRVNRENFGRLAEYYNSEYERLAP